MAQQPTTEKRYRDTRVGEAGTDPELSQANDPTHGVDPAAAPVDEPAPIPEARGAAAFEGAEQRADHAPRGGMRIAVWLAVALVAIAILWSVLT
ncbi:hypothetical protein HKCCE2091_01255 [Rhodobacterales bacterium HKCCE2091]|nr:hypothetical protein [Rhodobacterales bacterium HKCCE2091]